MLSVNAWYPLTPFTTGNQFNSMETTIVPNHVTTKKLAVDGAN